MASFLNADLPSEDEEDLNYNPEADDDAEKAPKKSKTEPTRSRRGAAVGTAPSGRTGDALGDVAKAAEAKRKAKAASLLEELNAASHLKQGKGIQRSAPPVQTKSVAKVVPVQPMVSTKRPLHDPDAYWMHTLGLADPPKKRAATKDLVAKILSNATRDPIVEAPAATATRLAPVLRTPATHGPGAELDTAQPPAQDDGEEVQAAPGAVEQLPSDAPGRDPGAASAAAAALRHIAAGVHAADGAKRASMVTVVEKRNFAGQEVEIARELQAGSKAAEAAQSRVAAAGGKSGLDAALANISGPRKANVVDKTADDWQGFKSQNAEIKDELNDYSKSSDKYLEKQAFLKRAELTEYEKQRDIRLQSDIRTRARA